MRFNNCTEPTVINKVITIVFQLIMKILTSHLTGNAKVLKILNVGNSSEVMFAIRKEGRMQGGRMGRRK